MILSRPVSISALASSSHKAGTDDWDRRPYHWFKVSMIQSSPPADQGWSALPAEKENRLITKKENPPDEQSLSSEGFC